MSDLNLGQLTEAWVWLFFMSCPLIVGFLFVKKKLTKSRFLRFLGILLIGTLSSMIPFGPFGLMVGFPSVLTASILVSVFLDKENEQK